MAESDCALQIANHQIRGVAFDLEGTVVDLEQLHFAAHVEAASLAGVELDLDDPRTFTHLVPHLIGGPDKTVMEEIRQLALDGGRDEGDIPSVEEMLAIDNEEYTNLRDAVDELPPREGFLAFLSELRALGIPTVIGTLTSHEAALTILQKSGLDRLFTRSQIVFAEDVRNGKPAPDVFLRTAQIMGINPAEQLVFEDSHNGVKAARAAGSIAIGVPVFDTPEILQRLRDEGASAVCLDWATVATTVLGPGLTAARPQQAEAEVELAF